MTTKAAEKNAELIEAAITHLQELAKLNRAMGDIAGNPGSVTYAMGKKMEKAYAERHSEISDLVENLLSAGDLCDETDEALGEFLEAPDGSCRSHN